jgi:hypothetical protein
VARGRLCTPHRSQLSPPTVPWSVPPPSNYMPFHALCPYPGNDSHHAFQRALAAAGLTIAARDGRLSRRPGRVGDFEVKAVSSPGREMLPLI